jgi:hypothetical protein
MNHREYMRICYGDLPEYSVGAYCCDCRAEIASGDERCGNCQARWKFLRTDENPYDKVTNQ